MTIRTIAVLGGGTMGRGIAHVSALAGYATRLYDSAEPALADARASIHKNLDKGVSLGKIEAGAAAGAKERLGVASGLAEAVAGADLVIEAVPESMALKIDLFREKIESGKAPVGNFYPDYQGGAYDVGAGQQFFADRFRSYVRQPNKETYVHFTNATDTDLLKKTMASVQDMIIKRNLNNLIL